MATVAKGLEKITIVVGNQVNRAKTAADKVLWGSVNEAPNIPAAPPGISGSTAPKPTKVGSFIQSGLFNCLDSLLTVDLCNIVNYLEQAANASAPIKKRKDPKDRSVLDEALYSLQDKATAVRQSIDTFYAFPNQVLTSLKPQQYPPSPAPGQPSSSVQLPGTQIQKYNLEVVGQYIKGTFAVQQAAAAEATSQLLNGLGDPDVVSALGSLPGLKNSLMSIQDFTISIDKYADFRTISNAEFQKLLNKLDKTRSVCVTIEGLSFDLAGAVNLAFQYLGSDIRSQIAKISQFLDPRKLVPTLKEINKAIRSIDNVAKTLESAVRTGRGVIKIALVLIKIFKFIASLISKIPAPLQFATYNMVASLENAKEKAKENSTALEKFLEQLNALMSIILDFIRYIRENLLALQTRIQSLLSKLQGCSSLENSDVTKEMQTAQQSLTATVASLDNVLKDYEVKANKSEEQYGPYTIRVVEEELVDEGIANKRRRGIALDQDGIIVAQSDLTFATNKAVIIEETKLKLVALGLIDDTLGEVDTTIIEALTYLREDNINLNNLGIPTSTLESPNSRNSRAGIGLSAYLNNLPGASKLRRRIKQRLRNADIEVRRRMAAEMTQTSEFLGIVGRTG